MADVKKEAERLEGWTLEGEKISKTFSFDGYLEGIAFVKKIAVYAEGVQHHPHVTIDHTNVTVLWTTVDQGALTEKDIAAARATDNLLKSDHV
ncbi:4a-hydroxytetrahydrobiopterin dehydratase [Natribacillus halophilus]|uniref:4a-hydroxytetrahydrobiopterin dehydratase n=1 Tax=Natribacillus halophilus TaxID=549003 RepID=A0A1G8LJ75_9BACI|nr:4a-hydroxytetrahydrobiopterin dehydratase [Natribacillus halophilus]SDI55726.1 pterin-4-alpha-carbinolamine dehydratase [Natribacillus halophilus]